MIEVASVPVCYASGLLVGVHVRLVGFVFEEIEGGGLAEMVEGVDVVSVKHHSAVVYEHVFEDEYLKRPRVTP